MVNNPNTQLGWLHKGVAFDNCKLPFASIESICSWKGQFFKQKVTNSSFSARFALLGKYLSNWHSHFLKCAFLP